MANVYTTAIIGETLTPGGVVLFNTPVGFMTVIRDISVLLAANGGGSCFLQVKINGGSFWVVGCPPGGQRFAQYDGRIAVSEGNEIQFVCESGSLLDLATVNCTVFELTLP